MKNATEAQDFESPTTAWAASTASELVKEAIIGLTRWGKDGRPEYGGHKGWGEIHRAYKVPGIYGKDVGRFLMLDKTRGQISAIHIAVYDAETEDGPHATVMPIGEKASVAGEWRDYVAILRPTDARGRVIAKAAPLFISHHGVDENATTLTRTPSSAVVCIAGMADMDALGHLNMRPGDVRMEHWQDCPDVAVRTVQRVISIFPHCAV